MKTITSVEACVTIKNPSHQKGLALVIFAVVIALAFISYFVSGLSLTEINVQRDKDTLKALNKAKQALIAYAVNYPEVNATVRGPGYLLCPDTGNNGDAEGGCNGLATVGRFPWRTLNVGDLRDGANERLWYAVSENFDYTDSPNPPGPETKVLNTATIGNITIRDRNSNIIYDGTSPDAAVAVIIAPGGVLTRDDGVVQDRSTAVNQEAAVNYLDIDTASGEDNANFQHNTLNGFIEGEIVNGAGNIIVNDQFVVITYGEIMEQIHKRVAGEVSNILNDYFDTCNSYPEASVFDPTKALFRSRAIDIPPPPPPLPYVELREGHLPVDQASPYNWGSVCDVGAGPVPVPVLPLWFQEENWHKTTYYAFAYDNALANGSDCGVGGHPPCMTVNNTNPPVNNAQALIVFAGRDTTGNRESNVMSDYFEVENNDLDITYDAGEEDDYVRVVTP